MDSFFAKGFQASKCKTLLKLTIPRIKLLRNRRQVQIKEMRRDIAKLLETGQEATARIRVEHIIREEKMMAAQEIVELFCELIAVRLPIIEAQRECPLDLKEAISSVCFAAPRCADLPELQQVQMLFAGKYGKEFVAAATELMPECGVNRQLIELLSIRAPASDVKLKLLKEIAEEHELDWDPSASETELMKPHEDLLNGPTQFVSGSKVPLPKEKHDESSHGASNQNSGERSDSDADYDSIDLPEVPMQPLRSSTGEVTAPEMLQFPASALSDGDCESTKTSGIDEGLPEEPHLKPEKVLQDNPTQESQTPINSAQSLEDKQFVPFILPPSRSSASVSARQSKPPPAILRTKSETNVDLQDVLAAAQAAAESAELAAAAARSAANLAQVRISELVKRKNNELSDSSIENPFHAETETSELPEKSHIGRQSSLTDSDADLRSSNLHYKSETHVAPQVSDISSYGDAKMDHASQPTSQVLGPGAAHHQFQRLPSMDDEAYLSYPNLFSSDGSVSGSLANSFTDNSRSTHD